MEINKQLFEDVLSSKLKGIFVLRNGSKIPSIYLQRKCKMLGEYLYYLNDFTITSTGRYYCDLGGSSPLDIIDFISDTDMKENELTIEIPAGKIVDWDESKKQNKIVLKDEQLTYKDICKKLFKNGYFFIYAGGCINHSTTSYSYYCANNATTEHQLKCILAKNQLANIAVYLNDGWKLTNTESTVYYLSMDLNNHIFVSSCSIYGGHYFCNIVFKSKELAQQAIEILGEETVKLALEPLGI